MTPNDALLEVTEYLSEHEVILSDGAMKDNADAMSLLVATDNAVGALVLNARAAVRMESARTFGLATSRLRKAQAEFAAATEMRVEVKQSTALEDHVAKMLQDAEDGMVDLSTVPSPVLGYMVNLADRIDLTVAVDSKGHPSIEADGNVDEVRKAFSARDAIDNIAEELGVVGPADMQDQVKAFVDYLNGVEDTVRDRSEEARAARADAETLATIRALLGLDSSVSSEDLIGWVALMVKREAAAKGEESPGQDITPAGWAPFASAADGPMMDVELPYPPHHLPPVGTLVEGERPSWDEAPDRIVRGTFNGDDGRRPGESVVMVDGQPYYVQSSTVIAVG